jgi:hypothetical protein
MTIDTNPRAVLGGNHPPEATPFERAEKEIGDLYDEAKLWLDGAAVEGEEVAGGLSNLLNLLRGAEKAADAAREAEKKPFLEAGRAVDAKFGPVIKRAKLAQDGCKKALAPWLEQKEAEKRAAAEVARREAEEKARAAEAAIRAASAANLEEREKAEALVKDAKRAEAKASKAEHDTAKAVGGIGRAVSLRPTYTPVLVDVKEALRHYWTAEHDEIVSLLNSLAARDVRAGARSIPGFDVIEEKKAV